MTRNGKDERGSFDAAKAAGLFSGSFCDWLHTGHDVRDAIDSSPVARGDILDVREETVAAGVDVLDLGIIQPAPERWVVWLNPGDRFHYLHGIRKPIAVCTDDAQIYPSKAAAQAAIDSHTAAWKTSFPHARPSKL